MGQLIVVIWLVTAGVSSFKKRLHRLFCKSVYEDGNQIMKNYDIKCKVIEEELRSVWPEWHVAGRLGGGTFGDVFQIYRDNCGIRVDSALKVIQVSSSESTVAMPINRNDDLQMEDEIPDELRSEIQIMEALRGAPNIVAIEDFHFKKDGLTCSLFVRMELLTSLQKILQGRAGQRSLSSIREIIKLGRDVCTALMYCEKKGIIHRDIKPENLFVDRFGDYKVGDFGVSRRMDTVHVAQTMTGIGTISYMAPEIFQGRSYNNTVDIYSLGLVLYQLLNSGRMPFLPAKGSYAMRDIDSANYKRLHGTPVPSLVGKSCAGEPISDWLDAAVRKACAVDSADRYQTAKEFYNALSYGEAEGNRQEEEEEKQREEEKKKRQEEEERKQREKEERKRHKEEKRAGNNEPVGIGKGLLIFIGVALLLVILSVRGLPGPPGPGPADPPGKGNTTETGGTAHTEEETGGGSGKSGTGEESVSYADIVRKYNNNYGTLSFDNDNGVYLGVFLAKLIDFDQDGSDELLIGYSEPIEDVSIIPAPKLDVWTMENGVPVQAYKGARVAHGDIGSHCAYCDLDGIYYLCTGTSGYALDLILLSLENGSFTQSLTLQADRADSNYAINGAVMDQDQWNELYQKIENNSEGHYYSGIIDNTVYETKEALQEAIAEDYKVFGM